MFLGLFLTCVLALAITTILLLLAGHRGHRTSRMLGLLLTVAVAIFAGQLAIVLFDLPGEHVLAAQAGLVIFGIAITLLRPQWSPIGQVFYGTLLASAVTYLSFAAWYTLFGGLSLVGALASGLLFLLELAALTLTSWYAFDSWTVAVTCIQGLVRSDMVFMRTPKTSDDPRAIDALRMAKPETFLALLLWAAGVAAALTGKATPFLIGLFAWQGSVYATSLYMSWLNVRGKLSPELERRRRSERLRDRRGARLAFALGSAGALVGAAILAAVLYLGGSNPGSPENPFVVPESSTGLIDTTETGPTGPTASTGSTGPTGSTATGPTGSTATGPTATGPTATGPTETSSPPPTTSASASPTP